MSAGSIHFDPLISSGSWLLLASAAAVLLAGYAWRRPAVITPRRWVRALMLMGASLLVVLLILLNPTWVKEIPPPAGKPVVTILVDDSASMAAPDEQGRSRFESARQQAGTMMGGLSDRFEPRLRTFSSGPAVVAIDSLSGRPPQGQVTDVARAITDCLGEEHASGHALVLLSDGIHNAGPGSGDVLQAVRAARALGVPIYTRTVGGHAPVKDLAVELRQSQDLTFAGQRLPIVARLSHQGLTGAPVAVSLLLDGKELERQQARLTDGKPAEVRFQVRQDEPGLYRYEIRVEPLLGEVTQVNNMAAYLLRVMDEPIRVLFVEGKPYWDSKFLTRTLGADASVELDSVVRLTSDRVIMRSLKRSAQSATSRPAGAKDVGRSRTGSSRNRGPAANDAEPTAPRDEWWQILPGSHNPLADAEKLRKYQLVLLGRDAELFLTDSVITGVRDWIARDGGALVCSRGAPTAQVNDALARLLPVRLAAGRESRFRVQLTPDGQTMDWLTALAPEAADILPHLPTLAAAADVPATKPLAVVLAAAVSQDAERRPVVTYQPYGTGRVVFVEGAGMWRWAFMAPEFQEHNEAYSALWHSLLHWLVSGGSLMPGQKVQLRADRITFTTEEPSTATLLLRDEAGRGSGATVELSGEGMAAPQQFQPVPLGDSPGTFRIAFGKLPPGRYAAKVVNAGAGDVHAQTTFEVQRFMAEQLDLEARPDLMERVARDSGGEVLVGAYPAQFANRFLAMLSRNNPPRFERAIAWDRWWVLVCIAGVWGVTWGLRRFGGLI